MILINVHNVFYTKYILYELKNFKSRRSKAISVSLNYYTTYVCIGVLYNIIGIVRQPLANFDSKTFSLTVPFICISSKVFIFFQP